MHTFAIVNSSSAKENIIEETKNYAVRKDTVDIDILVLALASLYLVDALAKKIGTNCLKKKELCK